MMFTQNNSLYRGKRTDHSDWKKWSMWLAFITCYLCHFIYVNKNQTRVIETEILSFWTTESNAEKFSAAVKFANEKTLGVRTLFPTVALPIPVTVGTTEYIKESNMKI